MAERFSPTPDYFITVRGDSMDRTGLRDGDEVSLKRFVWLDARHVELRPDSQNS